MPPDGGASVALPATLPVVAETVEVAPGITAIDTEMAGRRRATSAYLLPADEPALVETGPSTSARAVTEGLDALGVTPEDLAHVVVTHIHLDHAGAVGTLARRFRRATIWVHERGAPHLADPTRLVRSASRVYGEDRLRELFGPVEPVPADRLRPLSDGDKILLGGRALEVLYTPGHASHHVCLADSESGAVFTGDALGIHLPDVGVLRPATPPPEADVELSIQSVERIRARARSALLLSHFGPLGDIDEACSLAVARLRRWADIVREALSETDDPDRVGEILRRETAEEEGPALGRPEALDRYEVLGSYRMNAMGLIRYWKKRQEEAARS